MARRLSKEIRVEGKLQVVSGVHVGNTNEMLSLDMSVARAGDGSVYLPGTSLAGPMRRWWKLNFPDTFAAVWGDIKERSEQPRASLLRIHDAYCEVEGGLEVRDGVGIDRITGAAADKIKFDREVITGGTEFSFEAILEIPDEALLSKLVGLEEQSGKKNQPNAESTHDAEAIESQFAALLNALQEGQIRFGGAKTRGLGVLRLFSAKLEMVNLNSAQSLLGRLSSERRAGSGEYSKFLESAAEAMLRNTVEIEIKWNSTGPVMSKSSVETTLIGMLPLTFKSGTEAKLVLPGSGTKGAMRSFGERILRTVFGIACPSDFNEQIDQEGLHLVHLLFGKKPEANAGNGRAGALFIDDCYPEVPEISAKGLAAIEGAQPCQKEVDKRGSKEKAKSPTVEQKLQGNDWKDFYNSQHNAIDRWTGGAADSALYNMLLPPAAGDSTITMLLDLDRVEENSRMAALALLLLILREMKAGRIPLGFGVNRGLGTLEIKNIQLSGNGDFNRFDGELGAALNNAELKNAWEAYVANSSKEEAA